MKGGVKSAYKSIQTLTGKPPEKLALDMGMMDILISKPKVAPGSEGAIKYTRDIKQKTTGDISLGKVRGTEARSLAQAADAHHTRAYDRDGYQR